MAMVMVEKVVEELDDSLGSHTVCFLVAALQEIKETVLSELTTE